MSIKLDTFNNPAPYVQNQGAVPASMPIRLCTPVDPQTGPRTLRIDIPWTAFPYNGGSNKRQVAINVDLVAMSLSGSGAPLDAIRFCKIDNTYNDVGVYARFTDTGDVIYCPPNSIVGIPVQSGDQKAQLFGIGFFDGRTPQTSFFFSNTPQEPYVLQGAAGVVVNGGLSELSRQVGAAAAYGFPNVRVGLPINNRLLGLIAYAPTAGGARAVTSFTVNGLPVTIHDTAAGGQDRFVIASIQMDTGTTANVQLTYNGNMLYQFLATFPMTRNDGQLPAYFASNIDSIAAFGDKEISLNGIPGAYMAGAIGIDPGSATTGVPPNTYGDFRITGWRGSTVANPGAFGAIDLLAVEPTVYVEAAQSVKALGAASFI